MAFVQRKANTAGNADTVSVTLDTSVVSGNKLIVRCGSYNTTAITAGAVTSARVSGGFALDTQKKRTSDGFSVALLSGTIDSGGSCTVTLDVSGNNYYFLQVEEWGGLGSLGATAAGGEGSSASPSAGTVQHTADGIAFAAMTHANATTSLTPGTGWAQDDELEDNSTTLCYNVESRSASANTQYTGNWSAGASVSWIAVAAIFALAGTSISPPQGNLTFSPTAPTLGGGIAISPAAANLTLSSTTPTVVSNLLSAWNRTGGGTTDVANDSLSFSQTPVVGGTVVVTVSLWSSTVSGFSNQGFDPTSAMITDNNGGTSGSYSQAVLINATTGRPEAGGNINTPGVAVFYRRITSVTNTPYTVTFDIDPSSTGKGYWTWSILHVPDILETSPVDDTSTAFLPATLGGPTPTQITAGTSTSSTTRAIAVYHMHNGGHEGEADVSDPSGYVAVAHNEENSAYLSGHSGYKLLSATGDESPVMVITRNDGPTITYCRGVLAIFKLEGGTGVYEPTAAQLALSATAPTRFVSHLPAPASSNLALTATAPSVSQDHRPAAGVGQLALSTTAPQRVVNTLPASGAGTLALSATTPVVTQDHRPVPAAASLMLSSTAPSLGGQVVVTPDAGGLSLSATAPSRMVAHLLAPAAQNLVLSATAATVTVDHRPAPASGNLVLSATAPDAGTGLRANPADGQLVLASSASSVFQEHRPASSAAQLTLSASSPTVTSAAFNYGAVTFAAGSVRLRRAGFTGITLESS